MPGSRGDAPESRATLFEFGGGVSAGGANGRSDPNARKRAGFRGPRFPDSPRAGKNWHAKAAFLHVPAPQPPGESHNRKIAPSHDRTFEGCLSAAKVWLAH